MAQQAGELQPAVARALDHPGPALVDVLVTRRCSRSPWYQVTRRLGWSDDRFRCRLHPDVEARGR
jgi:hypothetical protein